MRRGRGTGTDTMCLVYRGLRRGVRDDIGGRGRRIRTSTSSPHRAPAPRLERRADRGPSACARRYRATPATIASRPPNPCAPQACPVVGLRLAFHALCSSGFNLGSISSATLKPLDAVSALKTLLQVVTEASDIICLMDDPSIEECLQPTYAIMIIMRELDGFTFGQEGTYSSPATLGIPTTGSVE
ncbi:hypothetical protein DFH06DRAFT_443422 [Mycena polygramma]|nr:hypothetical protein DFH06DRAFT_443422 [Mycena polygramma]